MSKKGFTKIVKNVEVTSGEAIRMARELQGLSQDDLAGLSGIPSSSLSGLETGKYQLDRKTAGLLAEALKINPSVLLFPCGGD